MKKKLMVRLALCYFVIFFSVLLRVVRVLNPLPDKKISDWSKLKQIAEDPFPNKPRFLRVCNTSLMKKCGKRRNCS